MSLYRYNQKKHLAKGSGNSLNISQTNTSAYSQVFNSKSIITHMIPSFLIHTSSKEGITPIDLIRLNLSKSKQDHTPQNIDLSASPIKRIETSSPENRLKAPQKTIESIVKEIFDSSLAPTETILKFNKKSLTRFDLLSFREGSDLPDVVIDCYMSVVKLINKSHSSHKDYEKVIILNTAYSNILFKSKRTVVPPTQNIFENKYLFIPIYEGYWNLLVVNLHTGVTHFYDGLVPNREIETILIILKRFLTLANIENVERVDERFIKYEKVNIPTQNMSLKDSGVFICKVAENLISQREIRSFDFRSSRREILNNLIRINLKLI